MVGDYMKGNNKKRKHKIKFSYGFILSIFIFFLVTVSLGYNLSNNLKTINDMKKEKVALNKKIKDLEKEQKDLELSINKLQDPNYIARYVREKYFYSKDGELILRIDE